MSAIDETGNSLIGYRLVPSAPVRPRLQRLDRDGHQSGCSVTIPHIELVVAVSSPFLLGYFEDAVCG
jgi:hypothetical protein